MCAAPENRSKRPGSVSGLEALAASGPLCPDGGDPGARRAQALGCRGTRSDPHDLEAPGSLSGLGDRRERGHFLVSRGAQGDYVTGASGNSDALLHLQQIRPASDRLLVAPCTKGVQGTYTVAAAGAAGAASVRQIPRGSACRSLPHLGQVPILHKLNHPVPGVEIEPRCLHEDTTIDK